MKVVIDEARIREILESYGSDPSHWPEVEHDAILAHLRGGAGETEALEAAGELDDLLAFSIVPPPSIALQERLLRSAPQPRLSRRVRLWWAAALLAGATGGVVAGSAAAAAFAPVEVPGYGRADATAFGAVLEPQAQGEAE